MSDWKSTNDPSEEQEQDWAAHRQRMSDIDRNLHLLTLENTGWRRWMFGRWAYKSEPFRNDIARRLERVEFMHESIHRRLIPYKE